MTIQELVSEITRFQNAGGQIVAMPADDPNQVLAVQDSLNLHFSSEFVQFYQTYSRIQIAHRRLRSIGILYDLYQEQKSSRVLPAKHLFPVLENFSGGYYYLVCGQGSLESESGRVLHYSDLGNPNEVEDSYGSYFAFVTELIQTAEDCM